MDRVLLVMVMERHNFDTQFIPACVRKHAAVCERCCVYTECRVKWIQWRWILLVETHVEVHRCECSSRAVCLFLFLFLFFDRNWDQRETITDAVLFHLILFFQKIFFCSGVWTLASRIEILYSELSSAKFEPSKCREKCLRVASFFIPFYKHLLLGLVIEKIMWQLIDARCFNSLLLGFYWLRLEFYYTFLS